MTTTILVTRARYGAEYVWPGTTLDTTTTSVPLIDGGLRWASADTLVSAAAAKARQMRLNGATIEDCERIMIEAAQASTTARLGDSNVTWGSQSATPVVSALLPATTADATKTTVAAFAKPNPLGASPENVAADFSVWVLGKASDGTAYNARLEGTFKWVGSGDATVVGDAASPTARADAGASAWSCSLEASGTSVIVTVTGASATSIEWVVVVTEGVR